MNIIGIALLAAAIATVGQWVKNKKVSMKMILAGLFMSFALATMSEFRPELASAFAVLILVTVTLTYIKPIVQKMGLA